MRTRWLPISTRRGFIGAKTLATFMDVLPWWWMISRGFMGLMSLSLLRCSGVGFTAFWQIATWSTDAVDVISGNLDLGNRIKRERWRPQARILAVLGR